MAEGRQPFLVIYSIVNNTPYLNTIQICAHTSTNDAHRFRFIFELINCVDNFLKFRNANSNL